MSRRSTVLLLAGMLALGAFWLHRYLSPGQVVTRKVLAAVAAFEDERLLAVMASVSREYSDPWGGEYEIVAGQLRELMTSYEGLDVDLVFGDLEVEDRLVVVNLEFVLSGRAGGERVLIFGSRDAPCSGRFAWRKEDVGWRLASTLDLDIPELRDELASRRRNAR
jgi:hypothetical protein